MKSPEVGLDLCNGYSLTVDVVAQIFKFAFASGMCLYVQHLTSSKLNLKYGSENVHLTAFVVFKFFKTKVLLAYTETYLRTYYAVYPQKSKY